MTDKNMSNKDQTDSEKLITILSLASEVRASENSPSWKTDTEKAIERHGEACQRLWSELNSLLDEQTGNSKIYRATKQEDQRKVLKKQIVSRIREEMPRFIDSIMEEFND